mmetsp:Transcript_51127/g.84869  ORF Transcript_51127/g.84869 Transcript_51127/m.84869 type:complete len:599 (-) Transcript_51127:91-1887(-)
MKAEHSPDPVMRAQISTDVEETKESDAGHREHDQEQEAKPELTPLHQSLKAWRDRAELVLSDTELPSPIEMSYKEKSSKFKYGKHPSSKLLETLLDEDQVIAPKLAYKEPLDARYPLEPKLGDLEKREIIIQHKKDALARKEKLWFAKTGSTRKVFISMKLKRISGIDNIRETFRMRFHIYLNWIMSEQEYRDYIEGKMKNPNQPYEPAWKPDLEFMNAVEVHQNEVFHYPEKGKYRVEIFKDFYVAKAHQIVDTNEFDPQLCRFIRCKLECDITFAEELELNSYPFDCQDLSVIIKGNYVNSKIKYVFLPELRAAKFASIDVRYSVLDEWELSTAFIEFLMDKSGRMTGREYPNIVIRLKVKRKWHIYVINIVLLLCALCFLSLSSFYLKFDQFGGERLSLLITLILTSVAFSIAIQDRIPNVSYLTFLDKYILMSYLYLILSIVETVGISTIEDDETREQYDRYLFWVFLVLWMLLMILVFVFYARHLIRSEEEKLLYNTDEVNEIVNTFMPSLVFDYKHLNRVGRKRRILSFMAKINTDTSLPITEYELTKSEQLRSKHEKRVSMQVLDAQMDNMQRGVSADGSVATKADTVSFG